MAKKLKQIIDIKLLPGEPTDGSGKVCIHLFIRDENGSFTEPHVLQQVTNKEGQTSNVAKSARGRIACDSKRTPRTGSKGNVTVVLMRTDDARAVTCHKCKVTEEYSKLMLTYDAINPAATSVNTSSTNQVNNQERV